MNIGFIGLGKLGLPCALAIESKGHIVKGYDISLDVQQYIKEKKIPYKEGHVNTLLPQSKIELLPLTELVQFSDIIFVAIQTPHDEKYEGISRLPEDRIDFDYQYLINGIQALSDTLNDIKQTQHVVIISTVLPGTLKQYILPILSPYIQLAYNPFFIAMGTTIDDFLCPEFVLLGAQAPDTTAILKSFYSSIHSASVYETDIENAELIKVAYNTFIGMKIVFANTIMEITHKMGLDVDAVTDGLKLANTRLLSGAYLSGGMGDGGGCHPRDNIALSYLARKLDLSYDFFDSIMQAREDQTAWLADLMDAYDLPKVILGKSFKANINITTGSPALLLKTILEERGTQVEMFDPHIDAISHLNPLLETPHVYFIGTKHEIFKTYTFPKDSVVIDPWRYLEKQPDITFIPIGAPTKAGTAIRAL